MTKRYRKIDSAYEPECDYDDCNRLAVITDGEMNWCEEHAPKHGGARPGAGRKPDSAKAQTREPLYQQGYGAGYHAALRSKLAAGGWLVRRYGSQWEYEAPDHAVVPVERELAEALVEQGIVVADSANSGEEDRWMVFKLAERGK